MSTSPELVAEGVYRVADGPVNWFLVEDEGRVAIYDTGFPRNRSNVAPALEAIGASASTVESIVLTHGHPDHLGSAEALRTELGVPVLAHETEVDRVQGSAKGSSPLALVPALTLQLWRPHALGFVLNATAKGFLIPKWVKEVTAFKAGSTVDAPGRPTVISTPGHTGGHVSFHFADRGVVIAGDALVTEDPVTGAKGPRLPHDVVASDPEQARRSLDALETLEARVLVGGHGDPWQGSMKDAVAHAREADTL